ncbi:MAG: hypothetical protein D6702_06335 [Planctomycetota bacterium]|nr:MAG: hypothetical protein D6702_06335 [Planctomycetota bacterium]
MDFLTALWLPILLSAVLVFVASSLLHIVLPFHRGDHRRLPGEEELLAAMREHGVERGVYLFPCPASIQDAAGEEMQEKYRRGPVGWMTVLPNGPIRMGRSLLHWFLFTLLIGIFAGYVLWHAVPAGADYLAVFRLAGGLGFLAYGIPALQDSIWKGQPLSITLKFVFDGLVYALVLAGCFAGFWPAPV